MFANEQRLEEEFFGEPAFPFKIDPNKDYSNDFGLVWFFNKGAR